MNIVTLHLSADVSSEVFGFAKSLGAVDWSRFNTKNFLFYTDP